nr:MAG TPA: hypothetical protein [Caudoviricetes sp.]
MRQVRRLSKVSLYPLIFTSHYDKLQVGIGAGAP